MQGVIYTNQKKSLLEHAISINQYKQSVPCKQFAERHNITIIKSFHDTDEIKTPNFQKMLKFLHAQDDILHVLIDHPARLSPLPDEQSKKLKKIYEAGGQILWPSPMLKIKF
jgi:hypothetical protein